MPRAMTTAQIDSFKARGGFGSIGLLDVQLRDGTLHYISTHAGSYPKKLGAAGSTVYKTWLESAGPFRRTRSLRTDAGDITLQNISGNTVDRDTALALKSEWEGALAIFRDWNILCEVSDEEFHGTLREGIVTETQVRFRFHQLLDPSVLTVPTESQIELCSWRFKSPQCGSTGAGTSCPKDFASCADSSRAATERYNGILTPPPLSVFAINPNYVKPAVGGGGTTILNRIQRTSPNYRK